MAATTDDIFSARIEKKALKRLQLIFGLLALSCLLCALLLAYIPPHDRTSLPNADIVDESLQRIVSDYGLSREQIRIRNVYSDTLFTRRHTLISVPSGFPSTAVHAKLVSELYPHGISVTGRRYFPENRLELQVTYAGRLVRTIEFVRSEVE